LENNEIIETTVPISIENLKKYFENKNIKFLINYNDSNLQEEKFLTYISNIDIPCDIIFDRKEENHVKLISHYMKMTNIVNLPSIENEVLSICLEASNYCDCGYKDFIEENKEIVKHWLEILKSMGLYNMYTITYDDNFKEYVKSHTNKNSNSIGLNFVNLLKYQETSLLFKINEGEEVYYYEDLFNEYMFKGNNLYYYWQNENNNLFLITWGVINGVWHDLKEKRKSNGVLNDTLV